MCMHKVCRSVLGRLDSILLLISIHTGHGEKRLGVPVSRMKCTVSSCLRDNLQIMVHLSNRGGKERTMHQQNDISL